MKIILNCDIANVGEVGDIKEVAPGFARNYLLPQGKALAHTPKNIAALQRRQHEINNAKEQKRLAARSLKEKIEAEEFIIYVPAGANGKLFGAVTSQTISDELIKKGIALDRKKIEVPGRAIKSIGNYKILLRLYEKEEVGLRLSIQAAEIKATPIAENTQKNERSTRQGKRAHKNNEGLEKKAQDLVSKSESSIGEPSASNA